MIILWTTISYSAYDSFPAGIPMHTKCLATLKRQIVLKQLVASAKKSIEQQASLTEIYQNMQQVFQQIEMNNALPLKTSVC